MAKKRAEEKGPEEIVVGEHVPRVHQPGLGMSEETARQLDLALFEMQGGKPLPEDSGGASLLAGPPTNRRSK
jgi:hypothetical protein